MIIFFPPAFSPFFFNKELIILSLSSRWCARRIETVASRTFGTGALPSVFLLPRTNLVDDWTLKARYPKNRKRKEGKEEKRVKRTSHVE